MKKVMSRGLTAVIISLAAAVLFSACGEKSPENILVKVDGSVITLDDFKREWNRQPPPSPGAPIERVDRFIDDMIAEKLFIIEARRRKIDQDEIFKTEVEKYREQLMVESLLNQEVLVVERTTEAEITEYWNNNKEDFFIPILTRFSHILMKAGEDEEGEEVLSRCLEAKKRIASGEEFADVAREVSIGSSAQRGGDLGYYRPNQISPEFQDSTENLDIGEVSEPIKTDYGYHIIVVTDRKEPRQKPVEESREDIIAILLAGKRKAKFDAVRARLGASVEIWKNTDLIDRLRAEQQKEMERAM